VRQLFHLAHAQTFAAEGQHKLLDLLRLTPFIRINWRKQAHIGIDRKGPAKSCRRTGSLIPAKRPRRTLTRLCSGKVQRQSAPRLSTGVFEFGNEGGLFQDVQRAVIGSPQQTQDPTASSGPSEL